MSALEISSFVFGIIAILLFGLLAAYIGHVKYHRHGSQVLDTIEFTTARNSLGVITIAWSFYSNAVGSSTAFFPPSYTATPGIGIVGMITNSVASCLPVFVVCFFGSKIRSAYPEATSLSNFMYIRYGRLVQIIVGLIVLFNMMMALIVEYTAIASIYRDLVGSNYSLIVLVFVGVVTSAYTSYGGLYASLATDKWQGVAGLLLLGVMVIFTAGFANLNLGPFPESLKPQSAGWASIFVLPISILTGTLLSEATFQRVWASYNNSTLKKGAFLSSILIFSVVLLFSLGGLLVVWSGRQVSNPNNVLFGLVGPPFAPTPITVLVVVLLTIMNTSAVDSIQNGLVSAISTNFLLKRSIWMSRLAGIILNGLCLAIGYMQFSSIVTLFAITNIITTMSAVFFVGLFDFKSTYVTANGVIFGFVFAFWWIIVYGWAVTGAVDTGLKFVFLLDVYNWPPFLIALSSILGLWIYEFTRIRYFTPRIPKSDDERTLHEQDRE